MRHMYLPLSLSKYTFESLYVFAAYASSLFASFEDVGKPLYLWQNGDPAYASFPCVSAEKDNWPPFTNLLNFPFFALFHSFNNFTNCINLSWSHSI